MSSRGRFIWSRRLCTSDRGTLPCRHRLSCTSALGRRTNPRSNGSGLGGVPSGNGATGSIDTMDGTDRPCTAAAGIERQARSGAVTSACGVNAPNAAHHRREFVHTEFHWKPKLLFLLDIFLGILDGTPAHTPRSFRCKSLTSIGHNLLPPSYKGPLQHALSDVRGGRHAVPRTAASPARQRPAWLQQGVERLRRRTVAGRLRPCVRSPRLGPFTSASRTNTRGTPSRCWAHRHRACVGVRCSSPVLWSAGHLADRRLCAAARHDRAPVSGAIVGPRSAAWLTVTDQSDRDAPRPSHGAYPGGARHPRAERGRARRVRWALYDQT